jgi:hypothetical protein
MSSDLHELVAAYALDALDDDERERFERHLAECERCSEQLPELQEAAGALAYAAEGPEPPAALRGRILDAARAEPRGKVIAFPKSRWTLPAVGSVAAIAAVVAIGLGVWANSLSNSLDRERSVKEGYARAVELLGADASLTKLADGKGGLLVANSRDAALVLCGLSPAPSGKTYEAWVVEGKTPSPAGLFQGGGGCQPVLLNRPVPQGAVVAVTLERSAGEQKPTTPILVHSEPA